MASASKHKDEAWDFIAWITAPVQNAEFAKASGYLPIHSVTYDRDPYFSGSTYKAWADIINISGYVTFVSDDRRSDLMSQWSQRFQDDLQAALLNQKTPEEICTGWDAFWKK
jgi:multiple sugar transport system substrate-binding protein